jgi:putative transposase
MSNYRRDYSTGATWFFTIVTYQRREFLCDDKVRKALRDAIRKVQTKYPFEINAWVLLPDHFHCIWTLPEQDSNFQLRIRLLKRYVTQTCSCILHRDSLNTPSRRKRKESTIWQRRYWEHKIRTETDFKHHMDYIHYNPVKHGLSESPSEWSYSTIHRLMKQSVYPENWASKPKNTQHKDHTYGETP